MCWFALYLYINSINAMLKAYKAGYGYGQKEHKNSTLQMATVE